MAGVSKSDLDNAAAELSQLTGDEYKIILAHQTAKLVKVRKGRTSHDIVFYEDTNAKLISLIYTFVSGIREGQELPNADLTDPEKALARIKKELTALQGAAPKGGEYPSGYHDNVLRAINAVNAATDYAKGGPI